MGLLPRRRWRSECLAAPRRPSNYTTARAFRNQPGRSIPEIELGTRGPLLDFTRSVVTQRPLVEFGGAPMHCACPAPTPRVRPYSKLIVTLLLTIVVSLRAHAAGATPITSRLLIDPTGEHNADFFGTSVAWVGDVHGDGYDDVVVGAFRYPERGRMGRAYLDFGGPAMDAVPDLVIDPPPAGAGWFGTSVASAGDFNGDGHPDFIIGARQAGNEGR